MDIIDIKVGSVVELEHQDGSSIRVVITAIKGLELRCRSIAATNVNGEWQSKVGSVGTWNVQSKGIKTVTVIGDEETRIQ